MIMTDFIQMHSFAVKGRRRSSVGCYSESDTQTLTHYGQGTYIAAEGMFCTTVHQLMAAPKKGTHNAHRYQGLVQSRVPGKDNTLCKEHPDGNFIFALVKYTMEFCEMLATETVQVSCDDMNKVHVGTWQCLSTTKLAASSLKMMGLGTVSMTSRFLIQRSGDLVPGM